MAMATSAAETLGALLGEAGEFVDIPVPDAPPGKTKSKGTEVADSTIIGYKPFGNLVRRLCQYQRRACRNNAGA